MTKLKPFDLEAAKSGDPICTWDHRQLFFIGVSYDKNFVCSEMNGRNIAEWSANNLRMLPRKKIVYVNLYDNGEASYHESSEDAVQHAEHFNDWFIKHVALPLEVEE